MKDAFTGSMSSKDAVKHMINNDGAEAVDEALAGLGANPEVEVGYRNINGNPGNHSGIEGKGQPAHTLTELQINGVDANLGRGVREQLGIGLEEADLHSYEEAGEALDVSEMFTKVVAAGDDEEPDVFVVDNGMGQPAERFTETFCELFTGGSQKQDITFMQGVHGMGSHASLQHCGESTQLEGHGYKLLVSADHRAPGEWAWTLFRRQPEDDATFEYLVLDGEIPTFGEAELEVPAGNEEASISHGTMVKLFEYQFNQNASAKPITDKASKVQNVLNKHLSDTVVPMELIDARGSSTNTEVIRGLNKEIDASRPEVEEHYHIEKTPDDESLGTQSIDVYVGRQHDEVTESEEMSERWWRQFFSGDQRFRVAVTVNGERHESLSTQNIRNNCGLDQLASDMMVVVDLRDPHWKKVTRMFSADRNGGSEGAASFTALKDAIYEALGNHDGLYELEARRMNASSDAETDEKVEDHLKELLDRQPSIADQFRGSDLVDGIKVGGDDNDNGGGGDVTVTETDYERAAPPTHLRPVESFTNRSEYSVWPPADPESETTDPVDDPAAGVNDRYQHVLGEESRTRLRFECNAPNSYFSDAEGEYDGELTFHVEDCEYDADELVSSWTLADGFLTITFDAVEDVPGDLPEETFIVRVTRPEQRSLMREIRFDSTEFDRTPSVERSNGPVIGVDPKMSDEISKPAIIKPDSEPVEIIAKRNAESVLDVLSNFGIEYADDDIPAEPADERTRYVLARWKAYVVIRSIIAYEEAKEAVEDGQFEETVKELVEFNVKAEARTFAEDGIEDDPF